MKVRAAYFDATEDLNPVPIEWNWQSGVKAGAEKTLRWEDPYYERGHVGWLVVPTKILFEDRTTWDMQTDTDSNAMAGCYGEYWRDKKHPRLTALPPEVLRVTADKPAADK